MIAGQTYDEADFGFRNTALHGITDKDVQMAGQINEVLGDR